MTHLDLLRSFRSLLRHLKYKKATYFFSPSIRMSKKNIVVDDKR